jgi:hypothetical protein
MANGDVDITEGSGLKVATYTISEDAVTRNIQRVGLNHSDGTVLSDATGVKISTSQLATLNTTAQAMSAGFQLVSLPTDASLPAGTNAIGKLAANSGVDIGDVDVTSISAGENHLGEVGGKTAVRSVTLSTDTSAYASGDLIADTQQIDGFFRKTDGTGVINSINIIDEDAQGVALYIIFMSTTTSLGTENSAPNISDANLTAGFQGIVSVATTDYVTVSGTKVATIKNIGLPVQAVSGTDDLYIAVLNGTGTPTFTASGLEMRIGVLLD